MRSIITKENLDCKCGCKGWWELCCENKSNREVFVISPCPSPNRTDDDWFIMTINPLYDVKKCIKRVGKTSIKNPYHISAKYLSDCVDKYYGK